MRRQLGHELPEAGKKSSIKFNKAVEAALRCRAQKSGRTLTMEIHFLLSMGMDILDYESDRLGRFVDVTEGHSRVKEIREAISLPA